MAINQFVLQFGAGHAGIPDDETCLRSELGRRRAHAIVGTIAGGPGDVSPAEEVGGR